MSKAPMAAQMLFSDPEPEEPMPPLKRDFDDFGADVMAPRTSQGSARFVFDQRAALSTATPEADEDDHLRADALMRTPPTPSRPDPAKSALSADEELHASAMALKSAALGATASKFDPDRDPDLPLEPGAGRPGGTASDADLVLDAKPEDAEEQHAGRMQSARAKFIDAARRAAQAAAEQSADVLVDPVTDDKTRPTPAGPKAKSFGRLSGASYKKPLLLGLAAIVFAAGGLSVYNARSVIFSALDGKSVDRKADGVDADTTKKTSDRAALPNADAPKVEQSAAAPATATKVDAVQPLERPIVIVPTDSPLDNGQRDESGSPVGTKPAKVSAISGGQSLPEPASVGAIPSRKLPTLAQPFAADKDQGKVAIARIGATPTPEVAIETLRAQADAGNIRAQYDLGSRYIDGRGVAANPKTAIQWLEKAAANGYAPAQYRLGSLYRDGKGLRNDAQLAYQWFKRAAEQGHARAMHNLAVVMAEGGNGTPDYAAAAEWFRKGAEYGIKDSQFNVAILYARGLGISQDLVQSYKWFSAAADSGDDDAAKKRDEVGAKLSSDKLIEAKAAAQDYRPKPLDPLVNDVQPAVKPVAGIPLNRFGAKS